MKNRIFLFITILCTYFIKAQTLPQTISDTTFIIGKTVKIKSKILNENRELNIYLPASYNLDSLKTYPVIYLLDGSKDEDFIHIFRNCAIWFVFLD